MTRDQFEKSIQAAILSDAESAHIACLHDTLEMIAAITSDYVENQRMSAADTQQVLELARGALR